MKKGLSRSISMIVSAVITVSCFTSIALPAYAEGEEHSQTSTIRFYSGNGTVQEVRAVELTMNDENEITTDVSENETVTDAPGDEIEEPVPEELLLSAVIEMPEIAGYEEYMPIGWRRDGRPEIDDGLYEPGSEVTISVSDLSFYAVYENDFTLRYDEESAGEIEPETVKHLFNSAGTTNEPVFTLADAPRKNDDEFIVWAIGSKEGLEYSPGDTIPATEDMTAYAIWDSENNINEFTVTYNYSANGGEGIVDSDTNKSSFRVGSKADLSLEAYKEGYEFVGWNTDRAAHEGLSEFVVMRRTTLYAIYKKELTASFVKSCESHRITDGSGNTKE